MGITLKAAASLAIGLIGIFAVSIGLAYVAADFLLDTSDRQVMSGLAQAFATLAAGVFVVLAAIGAVHAARIQKDGTVEAAHLSIKATRDSKDSDRLLRAKALAAELEIEVSEVESILDMARLTCSGRKENAWLNPEHFDEIPALLMQQWPLEHRAELGPTIAALTSRFANCCAGIRTALKEMRLEAEGTMSRAQCEANFEYWLERAIRMQVALAKAAVFVLNADNVAAIDAYKVDLGKAEAVD